MTDAERIVALERQLSEAREDADKAWAQARGATKTRDALQVKLINMANERDSLEKDLAGVRETIVAVRKRAEHAEHERDEAKNLLAAANERAERVERELMGVHDACHKECHGPVDLAAEIRTFRRDLTASEARVAELESQNADLDEQVANNDAERGEALEKLAVSEARCAELERLLAHARDTAAENLEDKRIVQARCAELEKKQKLAATDAFRVGQAYHEQSRRMRAAEARVAELEGDHAAETVGCCARYIWGDGVHNLDCPVSLLAASAPGKEEDHG